MLRRVERLRFSSLRFSALRFSSLRFSALCGCASVAQHARIIELCAAAAADADGAAAATRENWQMLTPLLDALLSGDDSSAR